MKVSKIFLLALICVLTLSSCHGDAPRCFMFESLDELQALYQLEYTNSEVIKHNSAEDDEHIEDLEYSDCFIAEYKSNEVTFKIYAYEFKNAADSKAYFKNVTGKKNPKDADFSSSVGLGLDFKSHYQLVVIDGERAYKVEAPGKHAEEIEKCLQIIFSKEI